MTDHRESSLRKLSRPSMYVVKGEEMGGEWWAWEFRGGGSFVEVNSCNPK
jgi:hypothetical protein